jgi:hypothetical protein
MFWSELEGDVIASEVDEGCCKGMTLWTPTHAPRLPTIPLKPYDILQTSTATLNIVSRLQRSLQNFRDLHKPSWIFGCPLLPSDTFRHLSPPSGCLMYLAPQWGPEKMDKEIDPGWGGLTPIPLLH